MIKQYLETMVKFQGIYTDRLDAKYKSLYDFVLQNGMEFKAQVFPHEKFEGAPRKKRECFRNAWLLSEWYDLIYVEGYAINIIPTLHAWCIDDKLNVYDPTWDNPDQCFYFGVPFNNHYVGNTIFERARYGVLDNYEMRYPLLTGVHSDFKYQFKNKKA